MRTKVEIGKKYGRLTVLELIGRTKHGCLLYRCRCECGAIKNVESRGLTDGRVLSCGCLKSKSLNMCQSITYKSWMSAKQRCYNPNNHNYSKYGGRGITMCDKWKHSFVAFLHDMGERPSRLHTLDRIDTNGSYEPSNCRWATAKEQGNNRRDNHLIEIDGKTLTTSQFAEEYDINYSNIKMELRKGLTPKEIITKYKNIEALMEARRKRSIENLPKRGKVKMSKPMEFVEVEELSNTDRGTKGYGSTGK